MALYCSILNIIGFNQGIIFNGHVNFCTTANKFLWRKRLTIYFGTAFGV